MESSWKIEKAEIIREMQDLLRSGKTEPLAGSGSKSVLSHGDDGNSSLMYAAISVRRASIYSD
jgi:hypothetical protein